MTSTSANSAPPNTELHRGALLAGRQPTPELEAQLDFLEREGLLLSDDEYERRSALGLPVYPDA